jgi:hypothetical protein
MYIYWLLEYVCIFYKLSFHDWVRECALVYLLSLFFFQGDGSEYLQNKRYMKSFVIIIQQVEDIYLHTRYWKVEFVVGLPTYLQNKINSLQYHIEPIWISNKKQEAHGPHHSPE